jgi:hypothetical protein
MSPWLRWFQLLQDSRCIETYTHVVMVPVLCVMEHVMSVTQHACVTQQATLRWQHKTQETERQRNYQELEAKAVAMSTCMQGNHACSVYRTRPCLCVWGASRKLGSLMDVQVQKPHANSVAACAARLLSHHNATMTEDNSVKPSQCSCHMSHGTSKDTIWATRLGIHT